MPDSDPEKESGNDHEGHPQPADSAAGCIVPDSDAGDEGDEGDEVDSDPEVDHEGDDGWPDLDSEVDSDPEEESDNESSTPPSDHCCDSDPEEESVDANLLYPCACAPMCSQTTRTQGSQCSDCSICLTCGVACLSHDCDCGANSTTVSQKEFRLQVEPMMRLDMPKKTYQTIRRFLSNWM